MCYNKLGNKNKSEVHSDICAECGGQTSAGCWSLVDGVAHYMHETCAEKVREQISEVNANRKERAEGSYGQGLIGALLGAAIGAIALLVKAGKSVADSKFVALK